MVVSDPLFEPAEAEPAYGVRAGRYRFPAPPGETGNSWMRMSNLAAAFSDQERLQLWLTWKVFEGLREHETIFDEWMAEPLDHLGEKERSALANLYAEKARQAAKADHAARRGTARHQMMENWYRAKVATGTRSMAAQRASAIECLDAHGFDVVRTEFKIWHPIAGGTMGTADAEIMCRRTGQYGILDWKTQARFWTWQEIAGQLCGYDSAPWVWEGPLSDEGRWVLSERFAGRWNHPLTWRDPDRPSGLLGHPDGEFAGRRVALVAHMPQHPGPGQLPVTLHEVDLEYGRQVLECAARNVELRSIGRSVAIGRRVGVARPL